MRPMESWAELQTYPLLLAAGTAEAASEVCLLLTARLRLLHQQKVQVAKRIEDVLDQLALGSANDENQRGHRDVEVLRSGRRIREMRGFDMTQEEFADRIDISENYLCTMERGKAEIGAEILLRISQEFAKSVEWLLMMLNVLCPNSSKI